MWNDKYKPKSMKEYVGQKNAVDAFFKWITNWKPGRSIIFHGPPGSGKTALVESFAQENNYELIEMNASDFRNKKEIEEVLGKSMKQSSLFGRKKLFLFDEVDGLAGREDLGGAGALIQIIKESAFPVILTCNDAYDQKLRSLREYCQLVEFKKLTVFDMEKHLKRISENESITIEKEVMRQLTKRSEGDLRAAVIDFESLSKGKNQINQDDILELDQREKQQSIFNALMILFKTKSALAAKLSINNVDKDPDEIFWWIENNILNEYDDPIEIVKAYEILSKADVFRQRVRSRQNWKLMSYMIDLMTAGVALSKKEMYRKFSRYQYPSNIIVLGGSKIERKDEKERLLELSKELHCSTKKIRREFLPFMNIMKYTG